MASGLAEISANPGRLTFVKGVAGLRLAHDRWPKFLSNFLMEVPDLSKGNSLPPDADVPALWCSDDKDRQGPAKK